MNKFILLVALFLPSFNSQAYSYYLCDDRLIDWQNDHQTIRGHSGSFSQSDMQDALDRQIQRFNFNPSKLRFDLQFGDNDIGFDNDQNEVWFLSVSQEYLTNRIAYTRTVILCNSSKSELLESDILLQGDSNKVSWSVSDNRSSLKNYGGNNSALRTTLMHELGHVAGLLHTLGTYGVMGNASRHSNTNGNSARTYFGEEAGDAVVDMYGTADAVVEDLAVSHWKFLSAGQNAVTDYSTHTRTQVYDQTGAVIEEIEDKNAEKHYVVEKGQTIKVEFTYENNGQSNLDTEVAYYLSGNNTISTGDLLLLASQFSLSRDQAYTTKAEVTIPNWVPSGFYFVGVIIDYNNQISEKTASNNATYIGIKVLMDNNNI